MHDGFHTGFEDPLHVDCRKAVRLYQRQRADACNSVARTRFPVLGCNGEEPDASQRLHHRRTWLPGGVSRLSCRERVQMPVKGWIGGKTTQLLTRRDEAPIRASGPRGNQMSSVFLQISLALALSRVTEARPVMER